MKRSTRIVVEDILDLFLWSMTKLSRPTFRNLLAGYEEYAHDPLNWPRIAHLEKLKFLERHGRAEEAVYSITPLGLRQVTTIDPPGAWQREWDGTWRVLVFDVPEVNRKDRVILWRHLRNLKYGCLQGSVWVWPGPMEEMLQQFLDAKGIPECFAGFEISKFFLCNQEELVRGSWPWNEIRHRQIAFTQSAPTLSREIVRITTLGQWSRLARLIRRSHAHSFALDPMLPAVLHPRDYAGKKTHEAYLRLRSQLGTKLKSLTDTTPR